MHSQNTCSQLLASLFILAPLFSASAAITTTGDVAPADPGSLTPGQNLTVGITGSGSMTIDQASHLISKNAVIADAETAQGTVTVTGAGSHWNVQDSLSVAWNGIGELRIRDGAVVTTGQPILIAINPDSQGTIHFDNGTLITPSIFGSLNNLTGTGTVYTNGLIADGVDAIAQSFFSPPTSFILDQNPGQNITVYLSPDDRGDLGAGFRGTGTLTIPEAQSVDSRNGYIGYHAGSMGTVRIQSHSHWNIKHSLSVGHQGDGELHISSGSTVKVKGDTKINRKPFTSGAIYFSNGTLITESLWTNTDDLHGSGRIEAQGIVADNLDLVFDNQHGPRQTIHLNNQPGQDIDLKLDLVYGNNRLGAGYKGTGSITIRDGVNITTERGSIGYFGGSNGSVLVTDPGTRWHITELLDFGVSGDAEMTIRDGAAVTTTSFWAGFYDEEQTNKAYINLTNGGTFAIYGETFYPHVTLTEFYERFFSYEHANADILRYWDADTNQWSNLANATPGHDYTIEHHDTGELAGYTVLTVHTAPEPGVLAIATFMLTGMSLLRHSRKSS